MARIAGITIEKDVRGNARYARIDLKKYGNLLSNFFKEVGIENEISYYDPKFVAKIRKSEKEFAEGKGVTVDIHNLWK
jgi:hypothetical protein